MAEEYAYNTIKPESMELEIGDMIENSRSSSSQASDNTMDRMKMVGDEDNSGKLTEEPTHPIEEEGGDLRKCNDIPEEQTMNILEEEGGHLRLNRKVLEELIANASVPKNATDPVGGNLEMNCDHILECMTITSSPAEQTTDLLEEVSEDLGRNGTFIPSKDNVSEDVREQRNSTAVIIGANHNFGVCSRYLSARLASCHDLCKLGHKHHHEDPKRRILGTISGMRPLMRRTGDAIFVSKVETKKKALLRRSSLPNTLVENGPQTHIESINHTKRDFNRLKMKCTQSEIKPPWAPTSGNSSSRSKTDVQASKKIVVRSPTLQENSSQTVKEIKTKKELGSHSRGANEKAKEPMNKPFSPKTPLTHEKSPSMKTKIYKNVQSLSHTKNQSNSKQNKINGSIDVPEKTLYMIEPSSDKKTAKRALKASSSSKNLQNTDKSRGPKSNPSTPRTPGALKGSPNVKEKLYKNPKGISRSKSQNIPEEAMITRSVDVPEKTLYMIESSSDKKPPRASISASSNKSLPDTPSASHGSKTNDAQNGIEVDHLSLSSTSISNLTVSRAQESSQPQVEDQMDVDSINTNQISETEDDGGSGPSTPRAISTVSSNSESESAGTSDLEEKDGSSWMVKFRRGTMVAYEVAETSLERLQFRRGRALVDDQNDKDEAVCLKKTEFTVNQFHDTKRRTGKVLLRHQEEVGKKGSLDLNNVIEETASKLVKTRKSKVKALVGAFETVMSLRDRKPLVETRVS